MFGFFAFFEAGVDFRNLLIFFELKKVLKNNVDLRMKNVATTWSKMEQFFMKNAKLERIITWFGSVTL